jgi:hypothetical protein
MVSRKKSFRRKSKSQKLYRMKGCNKSRKKFCGGESKSDMGLAYPSNNVPTVPNPFLAYTGKGGSSLNAAAYPSAGPPAGGFNFLNPQNTQRGGSCGCGLQSGGRTQKGGMCPSCLLPLAMLGGKYRRARKYNKHKRTMKGGTGNNGIPYPNGLVGSAWTSNMSTWPGVDGIDGNRNYLELNKYPTDPQTAMIATGAQPPFSIGGGRKKRRQKGGTLSNFMGQDFINLGRQFQHGLGTAYNGITGYPAPNSPLPWKGQLANSANLSTIKAAYI